MSADFSQVAGMLGQALAEHADLDRLPPACPCCGDGRPHTDNCPACGGGPGWADRLCAGCERAEGEAS